MHGHMWSDKMVSTCCLSKVLVPVMSIWLYNPNVLRIERVGLLVKPPGTGCGKKVAILGMCV